MKVLNFGSLNSGLCVPGGIYFDSRRNTGIKKQADLLWR